jgi:hypothetical protein
MLGSWLDRRLAEGSAPESRLLLAARSQVLVSPAKRLTLAHEWSDLLAQARIAPSLRDPRVPINRECIVASEPEIRVLLEVLVESKPIHVGGVALMSTLLTDGTGPLYNRNRSSELGGVLMEVSTLFTSSALFPGDS